MNVPEKRAFLDVLAKRRKKWKDPRYLAFDPDDIVDDDRIDETVASFLYAGKSAQVPAKSEAARARALAVQRRDKNKARALASAGANRARDIEQFHETHADDLLVAGSRMPLSRSKPLRILDASYDLRYACMNE